MRIVVRPTGGLGNQLFQYAAGRYYAQKQGVPLWIAAEHDRFRRSHGHGRPFLLDKFNIAAPIRRASLPELVLLSHRLPVALPAKPIGRMLGIQVIRESAQHEFCQDIGVSGTARIAYLAGFWQTYSLVKQLETELRAEFSLRDPPQGKNLQVAQRIADARNPVSLHVRRGDYVPMFGNAALLSMSYYDRAIERMRERVSGAQFFVFSDDSAFVGQHFGGDENFVIVDHNDDAAAHEDLRLMSQCHHHIVADSTFSWWGAWLNPRQEKCVIAPRKWLRFQTGEIDLIPPDWLLLDR